jgi:hypothetical protein
MKTIAIIITGVLFSYKIFSQDMINATDGRSISAKVLEIGSTEIKYKNSANQDGPVYVMNKSDISSIKYENGTEDVFAKTSQADQESNKVNGYNTDPNGGANTSSSPANNGYASSGGYNNGNYNNNRNGSWAQPLVWLAVGALLLNSQHSAQHHYVSHPNYYTHSCGHNVYGHHR